MRGAIIKVIRFVKSYDERRREVIELRCFQKGFNYSQDGPGNRLVLHLAGCNMRCPWCSNPEGLTAGESARVYPLEELYDEIFSCRPLFFDGGGVTFTGGEATLQKEPLLALLGKLREAGIHTAIETNGTSGALAEFIGKIDYWIIDFKHPDDEKCRRVTGVGNRQAAENIRMLCREGCHPHIRIPLIHGFNDVLEEQEGFIAFFSSLLSEGAAFDVELLPYHEYGKEKWEKAGLTYTVTDGFVPSETIRQFTGSLTEHGIPLIHT